jgi:hypothetical protein
MFTLDNEVIASAAVVTLILAVCGCGGCCILGLVAFFFYNVEVKIRQRGAGTDISNHLNDASSSAVYKRAGLCISTQDGSKRPSSYDL